MANGTAPAVDYAALAKQAGATSSAPPPSSGPVDYAALARQAGATSSTGAPPTLTPGPSAQTPAPKDNLSPAERRAVAARPGNPLNMQGQAGAAGKFQASMYSLTDTLREKATREGKPLGSGAGWYRPFADPSTYSEAAGDLAGLTGQPGTSAKNALLTAGAMTPYVRTALAPYFAYQGLKTALTGKQPGESEPDFVQRILLGSGMAAGAVAGGARAASPKDLMVSGEGIKAVPNAAPDVTPIINFARKAKSLNDINSAGTALMQGKVMPQVHKLHAAIHGEVERTAGTLIQADEADLSNVNQGTIHPTQATTKSVEFMDKTGWAPDPQSAANQLSTELNNAAGMKFKDAKLLRSRMGTAEAAAYRRGDNLAGGYLTAMRSGLSDAMASRADDLGMGKAWDHYNNEANAMFDLQRNNLFGDLLESRPGPDNTYRVLNGEDRLMPLVKRLAAKVETKGPATTFSGDLSQVRDWMQKYGLNVKDWDASLDHARSLTGAHEQLQKGFGQGLYRMVLSHPEHALLPLGVYAAMHGAGVYGFAPYLAASAVGSMSAKGSSLADAGRTIRSIREGVPPSAYQTMTDAQGPQAFTANPEFPASSGGGPPAPQGPGIWRGNNPATPASGPSAPPAVAKGLEGTDFEYVGRSEPHPGMGITELRQHGTNISVSVLDKDLNPETIRAKIEAKLKEFGQPLTQEQASEYLKRQAAGDAVKQMSEGKGPLGVAKEVDAPTRQKASLADQIRALRAGSEKTAPSKSSVSDEVSRRTTTSREKQVLADKIKRTEFQQWLKNRKGGG